MPTCLHNFLPMAWQACQCIGRCPCTDLHSLPVSPRLFSNPSISLYLLSLPLILRHSCPIAAKPWQLRLQTLTSRSTYIFFVISLLGESLPRVLSRVSPVSISKVQPCAITACLLVCLPVCQRRIRPSLYVHPFHRIKHVTNLEALPGCLVEARVITRRRAEASSRCGGEDNGASHPTYHRDHQASLAYISIDVVRLAGLSIPCSDTIYTPFSLPPLTIQ